MTSTTVRLDTQTRDRINGLARAAGISSSELLARALTAYEERLFWQDFEAAAAELRADPDAWAAEQSDRASWDATTSDGLR